MMQIDQEEGKRIYEHKIVKSFLEAVKTHCWTHLRLNMST